VVDLPPAQEKALNIALNKIAGDWDNEKLTTLIKEIRTEDIDIAIIGFTLEELNLLTDFSLADIPDDNKDINEDELAETIHECPKCGFKW
jgi:hypothetical protein